MEKIKFDYLLEHIELLNEMPKPPTSYGVLNNKFAEMRPLITSLDRRTFETGSAAGPRLFRKTVIGLYNTKVNEFKYTLPTINNRINSIVDSLFKKVDTDFTNFDIQTFEDIFPNSDSNPHYDSAIRLAEAIVYGKYHPDFRDKSPSEFAMLQIPNRVKKQLLDIMDNISSKTTNGGKLDDLLQQRLDMIENPDDDGLALLGPLDVVKYVTNSDKTDNKAVEDAYNILFVGPKFSSEKDPDVENRKKIINTPEFRDELTIDLFDYYRNSDRARSSSAMRSETLFKTATDVTKNEYSAMRNEVADIIKEIKTLNKFQRQSLTKTGNPMTVSPLLTKYKETGEAPKEDDEPNDDLNEYLSVVLSIWGVDIRKNINTEPNPSAGAFINSSVEPGVLIPRTAVNNITESSYNLISQFLTKYYTTYESNGAVFTADDFKTKIIDKIASLKTAQNEVEVLESIYNGLSDTTFGTTGSDDDENQIGGIENSVVRAVFDKPENEGKLETVKTVIKMQLQAIEAQLNYDMMRLMAAETNRMIDAGSQQSQQPTAQQTQQPAEEPVQESYVLNYMTEQIQKDYKFKGDNSQFIDRGFKKPNNYWHWMNK